MEQGNIHYESPGRADRKFFLLASIDGNSAMEELWQQGLNTYRREFGPLENTVFEIPFSSEEELIFEGILINRGIEYSVIDRTQRDQLEESADL